MSEFITSTLEILDLNKNIQERKQLIQDYIAYGILDKHKVIEKIRELQTTDLDITAATATVQAIRGAVILEYADDNTLIENLQFQIDILEGKLIEKTIKKAVEDK